jgi:hypothetical protein
MKFMLPETTVEIKQNIEELGVPENCILEREHLKNNETDFFFDVRNVARYRVQNGQVVSICPYKNADETSITLFLEGSVLGAVLHQRQILPFHGSSFEYKNKGVMICGRSGVGKSSVTAAFCQNGARYINDDISPVKIDESKTLILPYKTRIKLWDDTLEKLKIENNQLEKIRPQMDKFYLTMGDGNNTTFCLNQIFILHTHNKDNYEANELSGTQKYNALRKQIYRRVYLKGMPETEKVYFKQLFLLAAKVKVISVLRPQICNIYETMRFIENQL